MRDGLCLDNVRSHEPLYGTANIHSGYLHNRTRATRTLTRAGDPTSIKDDYHVTVRMGERGNIINLHGHLYMHRTRLTRIPVEMMTDDERWVELGKGRELRTWGLYPEESEEWPRLGRELPEFPGNWKLKRGNYPIVKYPNN